MKKELDEKLCAAYPLMFANRHADMRTTAMCWGFDCGDGWYNIINHLCGNIQHHIDWRKRQMEVAISYNDKIAKMKAGDFTDFEKDSEAWTPDYRDATRERMLKEGPREIPQPTAQVTVDQVKEKFGTLRFYYTGGDDEISGMVRMAESMSSCTCEECGAPGKRVGGGWVTTLCKEHAEARDLVYDEETDNEDSETN